MFSCDIIYTESTLRGSCRIIYNLYIVSLSLSLYIYILYSIGDRRLNEYGVMVELYMQSKTEFLGENPIQIPLHVPQIPLQLQFCIIGRPIKMGDFTKALLKASRCQWILLTTLKRFIKYKTVCRQSRHESQYPTRSVTVSKLQLHRVSQYASHITWFNMLQSHHESQYATVQSRASVC
jgi:hypothetical protein